MKDEFGDLEPEFGFGIGARRTARDLLAPPPYPHIDLPNPGSHVRRILFRALENLRAIEPSLNANEQLALRPVIVAGTTALCALLKGAEK